MMITRSSPIQCGKEIVGTERRNCSGIGVMDIPETKWDHAKDTFIIYKDLWL